jgi:prepilin-type N-terminal cleavage/methylation domain-containing protein
MLTNKGFTLIELMIVVVVIGVLAAIAIPNFMALQDRAREAATKSNGHTCQLAVECYGAINNGEYPPAATALADITANLPYGVVFDNPFTQGLGLTIDGGADEGMVDYLDPAAVGFLGKYQILCFGKGALNILVISNG